MTPFIIIIVLQIVSVSFILITSFAYDPILIAAHMAVMMVITGIVISIIGYIRSRAVHSAWLRMPMHLIGYGYTLFLFFFYALVIGSNYFWGNMVTYDIARNYIFNLNEFLNILPVQKWLLLLLIILYLVLVAFIYYLVRIRKRLPDAGSKPFLHNWSIGKKIAAGTILVFFLFIFRNPLLEAKRFLQFNQEPFVYFWLGPMWETHSDRLFLTQRARNSEDDRCIESITKKEPRNKTAVIILVDALRSDHLPMYGYNRNTSPYLDSMYKTGKIKRIKYAFSGSTNTVGGVSSLFFSTEWDKLNMTQLNLMQYFKKSGYTTYAFLTGYHSGWYGLSAMYRNSCDVFYESTSVYKKAIDDDLVTLQKFESTAIPKNSFVYIHLLSAHDVGRRDDKYRVFMPDKMGLSTGRHDPIVNHYDNGILQADFVISQIFENLKKRDLLEDATVFIVGDHGNLFGEEGVYGHAGGLHPKLLEVPILVYDNELQSTEFRDIASLMDIAPTFSEHFFGEIPFCWTGESLLKDKPKGYETVVTAATVKTDLYRGVISARNDTLKLEIADSKGNKVREYQKSGNDTWQLRFK